MQEITLSSGVVVRLRAVPPMCVTEVVVDRPDLMDPPLPYEEVEGIAGTSKLPAREGTDLYIDYFEEKRRIEALRVKLQDDFTWDYGVIEWQHPGEDFTSDPPKDWQFPQMLKDYGKQSRDGKHGRRVDYIKYTLLGTPDDVTAAQEIIYSITPISSVEVDAAADMFQGDQVG